MAHRVATSPLVKTALYGRDANWGRIVCAVGNSRLPVAEPRAVSLHLGAGVASAGGVSERLHLFRAGTPRDTNEEVAARILAGTDVTLTLDLGQVGGAGGGGEARVWTCDFSHEYVSVNADYRS